MRKDRIKGCRFGVVLAVGVIPEPHSYHASVPAAVFKSLTPRRKERIIKGIVLTLGIGAVIGRCTVRTAGKSAYIYEKKNETACGTVNVRFARRTVSPDRRGVTSGRVLYRFYCLSVAYTAVLHSCFRCRSTLYT